MNVQEMVSLFRNYANERPYANDTTESAVFWRTADIIEYLDRATIHYNALLNDLDESYNIDIHDISHSDIDLSTGNLLPENLQKIKLVTLIDLDSADAEKPEDEIKPINLTNKTRLSSYSNNSGGISARWFFQGDYIKFTNWDSGTTRTARIYYLKSLPKLKNYNDIPQLPEILHENIVVYGLIQGLLRDKQAMLAGYWKNNLEKLDKFAIGHLKPRQVQEPNHVSPREDWGGSFYGGE